MTQSTAHPDITGYPVVPSPQVRHARPGRTLQPGLEVFGFDGTHLGTISAIRRYERSFEVDCGSCHLMFPLDAIGLIAPDFAILRGTGRDLLAAGRIDPGTRVTPVRREEFPAV